ncbi:MAG: PAS domain S-box protein [Deltaproteobacteria bacterium]|nr:PAS domain S-box protein [Deltaproteobacteria bacterium]
MTIASTETGRNLRQRADEKTRLDGVTDSTPLSLDEARNLVYELQVHQVELEMQNEELRRTQHELEVSRSRYFDLYDLAPVGYLTLNAQGFIVETNLTAATMFGIERRNLLNKPITGYIAPNDQDDYYRYRKRIVEKGVMMAREMNMLRSDGTSFWAHLQAIPASNGECRVALTDITVRKQLEKALQNSNNQLHELVAEKTSQLADTLADLTRSEHFKQAIIDSLPANIAVIDLNGLITAINKPWLHFGYGNDIVDERCIAIGTDYLAPCRKVSALDDADSDTAFSALQGITSVLEGRETSFVMDYPCHSPTEQRWYQMSVIRPEAEFEGAVISHIDISSLKQYEEDRCSYITHLVEAIEQERFRTARELHDDLGQRLTVHSFAISRLKQKQHDKMEGPQILLDMQAGVDGMMESLRRICTNLRPALLDELGLSAALKWVTEDFTHHSGIPCSVTFNGGCCTGNAECAMTIFRIVQESLNNTIKHAGASRADVSFCRINGIVCVEISDDGCGIKSRKRSVSGSFGIIGMRERAHALGATFEIISNKSKGTNVKLVIPCKGQEGKDAVSHC